jgi:hypothetical protein
MNFKLFLYKKHDTDITLEDEIEHVKNMQYVIRVGESTWFYKNPDTRAYFEFQINDDNKHPEYDDYEYTGIACSVNFTTNEKKRIACFEVIERLIDQFDLFVTIQFITENPEQFDKDVLYNCFYVVNHDVLKQTNYNLDSFYIDEQAEDETIIKKNEEKMIETNYAEMDQDLFDSLLVKRRNNTLIKLILITISAGLYLVFTEFNAVIFYILFFSIALSWYGFIYYHTKQIKNMNEEELVNLYDKLLKQHVRKVDKHNKSAIYLKFLSSDKFQKYINKDYKVLDLVYLNGKKSHDDFVDKIYIIVGNNGEDASNLTINTSIYEKLELRQSEKIRLLDDNLLNGKGYIIPVAIRGINANNRIVVEVTYFDKLKRGYTEKQLCISYSHVGDIWLSSPADIPKYAKEWKYAGATSNYKFKIDGIEIFGEEWKGTGQIISVRDPLFKKPYDFDVFYIEKDNKFIMFALGMFANGIFGVYIKR